MKTNVETPVSFIKPDELIEAERAYAERRISADEFNAERSRAIAELVGRQKQSGLSVVTDGAFCRTNGLRDFWMDFGGVTPTIVVSGRIYQDENAGELIPKVTSRISYNPDHSVFAQYDMLKAMAGDAEVRIDIPAPALFMLDLVRNEWYDTDVYPSVQDMAEDIAEAYRLTIAELYARGCRRLLLSDRSWSRLSDRDGFKRLIQGGFDMTRVPEVLLDINNKALEGIPADMEVILFVPVKTNISADCGEVVNTVLRHDRVNAIMVNYPKQNTELLAMLETMPADKKIIFGVVDSRAPQLETPEQIEEMIELAARHIDRSRIAITTRGGFARNKAIVDFTAFTPEDQWLKLQLLQSI